MMKTKFDIVELANAFYKSFPNVQLDDLTIVAYDIVRENDGLDSLRNHLKKDELETYYWKVIDTVFLTNDEIEFKCFQLLKNNLKNIGSLENFSDLLL